MIDRDTTLRKPESKFDGRRVTMNYRVLQHCMSVVCYNLFPSGTDDKSDIEKIRDVLNTEATMPFLEPVYGDEDKTQIVMLETRIVTMSVFAGILLSATKLAQDLDFAYEPMVTPADKFQIVEITDLKPVVTGLIIPGVINGQYSNICFEFGHLAEEAKQTSYEGTVNLFTLELWRQVFALTINHELHYAKKGVPFEPEGIQEGIPLGYPIMTQSLIPGL